MLTLTQKTMYKWICEFFTKNDIKGATNFMKEYDVNIDDIGWFLDEYCSDDVRSFLCTCVEKDNNPEEEGMIYKVDF